MRMLLLATALLVTPSIASATDNSCDVRDHMIADLGSIYGEVLVSAGLAELTDGLKGIFEVWVSPVTQSWTIIQTTPDGLTCIMAAGSDWHNESGEGA